MSEQSEMDSTKDSAADSKDPHAGALFVLKSKGSWLHCVCHLTTATVSPVLLSLPFSFTMLGWTGGVLCLTVGCLVTFYCYNLLSLVLEHYAQLGKRHMCFRDIAHDILGPGCGQYFTGLLQLGMCYGAVIASTLLGGQSLKYIYLVATPNETMQLYQFIVIFGCLNLVMAQIPSFHSLRHINLVSLILCLCYSACTTAGSFYIGHSKNAPTKDYTVTEDGINRVFGIFNAISIISVTYANGILPEIQATMGPPSTGKMFNGLLVCYSVVVCTFFSVAIFGYWAFGNQAQPSILSNFMVNGRPLLPEWFLLTTYVLTLVQLSAVVLVYLQPTNVIIERQFADLKKGEFSIRNVVPRLAFRSLSIIVATAIAAMLPFFGNIMTSFGAFAAGCIPLNFILPIVFYNMTFRPSKRSFIFWANIVIIVISIVLLVVGIVASLRELILSVRMYNSLG